MSTFVLRKKDLDGNGLSHPAPYPVKLLPLLEELVPADEFPRVLDPFAGTGQIHKLPNETVGVEIEPEWAALHPDTICASALYLPFNSESFDAIVTSPTYGNRLADAGYSATPDTRNSYTFDLGRKLHADNSGGMQWGKRYRDFHRAAWKESARVLRHDGRFVLNIKDHIRRGKRQHVAGWHATTLVREIGLDLEFVHNFQSRGLPATTVKSGFPEHLFVFRKVSW